MKVSNPLRECPDSKARIVRVFHITEVDRDPQGYGFIVVRSQTEAPVGEEIGKTQTFATAQHLVNTEAAPGETCIITPKQGERRYFLIPSQAGVKLQEGQS